MRALAPTLLIASYLAVTACLAAAQAPARPSVDEASVRFFETEVRPILAANCFACHGGGGAAQANLRLTNRNAIVKGGNSGPAVSLAKPAESLLLKAVNYDGRQMPPAGKLSKAQIDTL